MITVKDIAEKAGVSRATVTFVLNKRPEGLRIRPETRERVLEAARDMGYMPNSSARAMRYGRSGCIALLLSSERHKSYFPVSLLEGIQFGLERHNLHLVVSALSDDKLTQENGLPKMLREWMADGLLIDYNMGIPPGVLDVIKKNRIPSIWINVNESYDCVRPDDFEAGYNAARYLIELGHQRIAYVDYSFVTDQDPSMIHYSTVYRFDGYCKAMLESGKETRKIAGAYAAEDRLSFSREWLSRPDRPTAVIAFAPEEAYPILLAATSFCRLDVPKDLSIVSFVDPPADILGIKLSGYALPERELGQLAVEELLLKIADPAVPLPAKALRLPFRDGQTATVAP